MATFQKRKAADEHAADAEKLSESWSPSEGELFIANIIKLS